MEIRLKNLGVTVPTAPNDPHSIHLHGLDVDAANDGVPETSVGAIPANLCADGTTSNDCSADRPGAGNVVVYMFSPKLRRHLHVPLPPGSRHPRADGHVRRAGGLQSEATAAATTAAPARAWAARCTAGSTTRITCCSSPRSAQRQHVAEEISGDLQPGELPPAVLVPQRPVLPQHHPRGVAWRRTAGATGSPRTRAMTRSSPAASARRSAAPDHQGRQGPDPDDQHGLTRPSRCTCTGSTARSSAPTSGPGTGRTRPAVTPFGLGLEKNTLTIGSGETYEWLVDFGQQSLASTYPAGNANGTVTAARSEVQPADGSPASNTQTGLPAIPDLGGAPYIAGPTVTGAVGHPD